MLKLLSQKYLYVLIGVAVVISGVFLLRRTTNFEVVGSSQLAQVAPGVPSGISGTACANSDRRPIAVMMASDPVTRPLSGISQADIVFEMPVTPGGITRTMAVFQCQEPALIGSVRSARQDFIPLAAGVGAIYAHWGGEHDALRELDGGIIDNIDAMKYEGTTFYRKGKLRPPHNGFTDTKQLLQRAESLGYSMINTFEGYPHADNKQERSMVNIATSIPVSYQAPYDVVWDYDAATGRYLRSRDSRPEIDGFTEQQVSAAVVIKMETHATPLDEFYNRVDVTGQGRATVYQGGMSLSATWRKGAALDSKLEFLDDAGRDIEFVPGNLWIEITTN